MHVAALIECVSLTDLVAALPKQEPVAWEYWRKIGVDDEERKVTHQPPDRVQQVELYEHRPLYAAPAALPDGKEVDDKTITELVYANFKGDLARGVLLRTVWKDSIDIDEPSYALKKFCVALLAKLGGSRE